jgi:hypothetical protein
MREYPRSRHAAEARGVERGYEAVLIETPDP